MWFCFGTTHFCDPCHSRYSECQTLHQEGRLPACPAGPCGTALEGPCPIGGRHRPGGEEQVLGCRECMMAHAAKMAQLHEGGGGAGAAGAEGGGGGGAAGAEGGGP